jgi:hypothetical protein
MKHLEEVIINYDKELMKANAKIEKLNTIIEDINKILNDDDLCHIEKLQKIKKLLGSDKE